MKTNLALLLLLLITITAKAQVVRVATSPAAIVNQIPGYSQVTTINTVTYSYTPSTPPAPPAPIDEDSTTEDDKVYHYADNIAVSITNANGNITSTSIGKVWTLRVSIPNALNVGFTFNQFNLSANAEMYIFNESRTVLDSCIKLSHFTNASEVGIFPFRGNSAIIYIVEPNNFGSLLSSVAIQNVEAGFNEMWDVGDSGGASREASVDCHPHIMCQPSRLTSARAVARMSYYGKTCTGTLINNEANNGRAFFLTAFHCIDVRGAIPYTGNGDIDPDEIAALKSARFQFQFWRPACNSATIHGGIVFSGATLRAWFKGSDVVLLELNNPPGVGDGVNYAGWNRQSGEPSDDFSYIIHHPEGHDMRITKTTNVKSWFWNDRFWTAHYSSGAVSKGSSGSALFNEYGQIVGQLRSGWSSCTFTNFGDRYGKFVSSWGNANLPPWLSPTQLVNSTNTLDLNPITITGANFIGCPPPDIPFSVPNLLGCTYVWTHSPNLQLLSGQNTPTATFRSLSALAVDAGWIRVTITDSKGVYRVVNVTRNLQLLRQTLTPGPLSWAWNVPPNRVRLSVDAVPAATSYRWYLDGVLKATTTSPFYNLPMSGNVSCDNFYYFGVRAVSNCGQSPESYVGATMPPCGSRFTVSPNPSSDNIRVQYNSDASAKSISGKAGIQVVELYDKTGILKYRQKFPAGHTIATIPVSSLPTDIYSLRIFDGETWHPYKVMVQH